MKFKTFLYHLNGNKFFWIEYKAYYSSHWLLLTRPDGEEATLKALKSAVYSYALGYEQGVRGR